MKLLLTCLISSALFLRIGFAPEDPDGRTNITSVKSTASAGGHLETIRSSRGSEIKEETGHVVPRGLVIEGPGVKKEFILGTDLPADLPWQLETLQGPENLLTLRSGNEEIPDPNIPHYMIGIRCTHCGAALRSHLHLEEDTILVADVVDGLPAAKAGLKPQDIILTIDGANVRGATNLIDRLTESGGKEITISGLRSGKPFNTRVTAELMTIRDAAAAAGETVPEEDAVWFDNSEVNLPAYARRWIMGPGIRVPEDASQEIEEVIREVRRLAHKKIAPNESQPGDQNTQNELQHKLLELQDQINFLRNRLKELDP